MSEQGVDPPDPWVNRIARDVAPPSAIRGRIVSALRAGGVVRGEARRTARWWQAAAAVLLFSAGWACGALVPRGTATHAGPRFVFFVYGEPGGASDARAAEYGAWARAASRDGKRVSGERLLDGGVVIGRSPAGEPGGFFIVDAPDANAAAALATGHPHVRDGGTIVIRQVAGR